ncbi:MAG: hypothetical protein KY428_07540, partial [Bacteroidetes bacterium]|nr:hypothetical protein [Bacteroidota bacterium]
GFLLMLLLGACSTAKQPLTETALPAPYSALAAGGLVYDAAFQYKDFNASGLLVIKRLDTGAFHVVLLSKFGPSLLEFKLDEGGMHWIKTFEQLNKRTVQKLLERDFRVLMLSSLDHPQFIELKSSSDALKVYRVKGDPDMKITLEAQSRRVLYAENRGFLNPVKTRAVFEYGEGNSIPKQISLTHRNVKMRLDLKLLKVNHAER